MKKKLASMLVIAGLQFSIAQTQVGDVTLKNTETLAGEDLSLNGAGMREKMWFDLYVGGLYTQSKMSSEDAVINADAPMAMKLHIVSKMVTQEKMINAVNDGFENASHGKATSAEQKQFIACFNEAIVAGNVFDIVYANGNTTVYKNGKQKGSVAGLEFKKALFSIWLGKEPADDDLKDAMLGK